MSTHMRANNARQRYASNDIQIIALLLGAILAGAAIGVALVLFVGGRL